MTWKQRIVTTLYPGSFGPSYRQSVIDTFEDALADIELRREQLSGAGNAGGADTFGVGFRCSRRAHA